MDVVKLSHHGKELPFSILNPNSSAKSLAAGPKRLLTNNLIACLELPLQIYLYRILSRIYYQIISLLRFI